MSWGETSLAHHLRRAHFDAGGRERRRRIAGTRHRHGSLAGYYGGRFDRFVNVVVMNAFLSFPGILLAIAFVAFLGPGLFNLILALVSNKIN